DPELFGEQRERLFGVAAVAELGDQERQQLHSIDVQQRGQAALVVARFARGLDLRFTDRSLALGICGVSQRFLARRLGLAVGYHLAVSDVHWEWSRRWVAPAGSYFGGGS